MEDKYLMKVYRSRTSYFLIYLMILTVLVFLGYVYSTHGEISKIALIISGVFIFSAIYITEIHRFREWWAITPESVIHNLSILNKNVMEVDFSKISDLELDQPFFSRLMGHGTVRIRMYTKFIPVINIYNPRKFLKTLQHSISEHGNKSSGGGL